jgi:hypothetical protein
MEKDSILIDILSMGEQWLKKNEGLTVDILRQELKKKGYNDNYVDIALKLFYPENFKNKYNEESWLSSDGHIRLLQYKSLEQSEANLEAAKNSLMETQKQNETAKKNLRMAKWTMKIAIMSMIFTMIFPLPFIQNRINPDNKKNIELQQQNEQRKLKLLEKIIFKQDSVVHSLEKIVNNSVKKDTVVTQLELSQ